MLIFQVLLFFQLMSPKMIIHVPQGTVCKESWFKKIKMKKEFVYYSPKSMKAVDFMSSSYYNYNFYLINTDLYYDKPNHPHYRIKGLSLLGRKCSVVTLKMNDKDIERVVLHETLHGFGKDHCSHEGCLLNDAKGKFNNLKNCNEFKGSCKDFAKQYLK